MLELININKTFDTNSDYSNKVINDLSLQINDQDFICIIGSNGSGKSTLFNLIAGTIYPDSGKILLNNKDITYEKEHIRANYIGRLFQDPMLGTAADLSVYENLMLAAKQGKWLSIPNKKDKEYLKEKLKELNMGLEDRMNTPVKYLSGGQRQALSLIMATINPPELLLLDEHTAALDPESANTVIKITNEIISKYHITCLMITHNMKDALKLGNRTIMLNKGKIIYDINEDEKKNMNVDDLIQIFKKQSKDDLDDKLLLTD